MENLKSKEQEGVRSELLKIVDDMCVRLAQQNSSYNSGVRTLILVTDTKPYNRRLFLHHALQVHCTCLEVKVSLSTKCLKLMTLLSASCGGGGGVHCVFSDLQAPSANFK
jgi:hypothetical protein